MLMYHNPFVLPTHDHFLFSGYMRIRFHSLPALRDRDVTSPLLFKIARKATRENTLRAFSLAIATLAAHEYLAFGCGSLFA